ncbi:MAG: hypothetical protein A2X86_01955 [Bdellovibrionales bacterium GWA2_49_15]|nr:MAG: hypothetical protein A2X86_01955 [Bdellovibrionales bacterium GWA2_49_15]
MVKGNEVYAGFWIRAVALLIDCVAFMVIVSLGSYLLFGNTADPAIMNENPLIFLLNMFFQILCSILYFGILQASMLGTPGKRIMGLRIVAADLTPASFGQCIGRYFASWLSSMILGLGYFWVGFTDKKQGWHDKIAGTCVVKAKFLEKSSVHADREKRAA